jgi:hypothetical protein
MQLLKEQGKQGRMEIQDLEEEANKLGKCIL